jgi:hypothetical protein
MDSNPYQSPPLSGVLNSIEPRSIATRKRLRGTVLLCFYSLMAANGALQASPPHTPMIGILLALAMASAVTYLCIVDSRIVGRPIVQSVHWIMFFTWPIAAPIYLIYSRGWRGVVLLLLHGVGLIVVVNAAFGLAWYLVHGGMRFE